MQFLNVPLAGTCSYDWTLMELSMETDMATSWLHTRCFMTCEHYCRGDFLGLCDQKSSCKHVSDFLRLWSYGQFLIPVHALVWTVSYGTSWRVMYSTWWLIVCVARIIFATWLAHPATDSAVPVISTLGRNAGKVGWVSIATGNVRSSQPSGSLCCGRRWHFRKPALSTDKFKLKVISRS